MYIRNNPQTKSATNRSKMLKGHKCVLAMQSAKLNEAEMQNATQIRQSGREESSLCKSFTSDQRLALQVHPEVKMLAIP